MPQMEMRAHALLCRRFISIPGAMWDGDWGDQFANSIKVEVDKLSRGAEKISTTISRTASSPTSGRRGRAAIPRQPHAGRAVAGRHYHFKAQQARDNARLGSDRRRASALIASGTNGPIPTTRTATTSASIPA
jgi:hypothetical protein